MHWLTELLRETWTATYQQTVLHARLSWQLSAFSIHMHLCIVFYDKESQSEETKLTGKRLRLETDEDSCLDKTRWCQHAAADWPAVTKCWSCEYSFCSESTCTVDQNHWHSAKWQKMASLHVTCRCVNTPSSCNMICNLASILTVPHFPHKPQLFHSLTPQIPSFTHCSYRLDCLHGL